MPKQKPTFKSLRAWRDAYDLKSLEAARRLGLTTSQYSRIENRLRAPRPKVAKAISEKTGVPLEAVLGL